MKTIQEFVNAILAEPAQLKLATWSAPIAKTGVYKARLKPAVLKGGLSFVLDTYTKTQSFTKIVTPADLQALFSSLCSEFRHLCMRFLDREVYVEATDQEMKVRTKQMTRSVPDLSHNRSKKYLLEEGVPHDFLIALGIQNADGTIKRQKHDKFKQIVHFLHLLTPVFEHLQNKKSLVILDLACGKAYLTFALYYYLTGRGHDVMVYGVDVRKDVIDSVNMLCSRLGYRGMHFVADTIEAFECPHADIVVSLHACNTATDQVIAKAVKIGAEAIVVAPCCQHELYHQMDKKAFELIGAHALLQERFCALLTDALRAELVKQYGYETDIVEFVDPEHTPKNLLIRAVRKHTTYKPDLSRYTETTRQCGVKPLLLTLLERIKDSP